jgi:hypothetical protein
LLSLFLLVGLTLAAEAAVVAHQPAGVASRLRPDHHRFRQRHSQCIEFKLKPGLADDRVAPSENNTSAREDNLRIGMTVNISTINNFHRHR